MMAARIVSILSGLLSIPILLSQLGGTDFAAWAVLFGGGVAFYTLEMGMTPTVVKFLAEAKRQDSVTVGTILSNATVLLGFSFTLFGLLITAFCNPLAAWLNLPDTRLFSAGGMIVFVFIAVGLSSLLRIGINTFFAAQRFDAVAGISIVQSVVSNFAISIAALLWHRLDLVLITYWSIQLLTLGFSLSWARRECPWSFLPQTIRLKRMSQMLGHGFNLQFNDLMYFVHFQFDKMIIAGFSGLTEVAYYEVASRAGQALRSLPLAAISTFLPSTTLKLSRGEDFWDDYLVMTRIAGIAAVFFLLLPMAVSPIFLFAWVGQVGYRGCWVFMLLATGISVSVLAMPVSNFIQAMGKTSIDARFAIFSITMNICFSLLLIQQWGKEGAAAGTGLALLITGVTYMNKFHRMQGRQLVKTLRHLLHLLWPAILICLVCYGIERAIEPLVIGSRWYMGPAAVNIYICGAIAILVVMNATGRFGESEKRLLAKIPLVKKVVQ